MEIKASMEVQLNTSILLISLRLTGRECLLIVVSVSPFTINIRVIKLVALGGWFV